jgi:hypothetical protein
MSDVEITSIWVSTSRQSRLIRCDRSAQSDRRFFERHGVDVATRLLLGEPFASALRQ